jgi:hypothetical protein
MIVCAAAMAAAEGGNGIWLSPGMFAPARKKEPKHKDPSIICARKLGIKSMKEKDITSVKSTRRNRLNDGASYKHGISYL